MNILFFLTPKSDTVYIYDNDSLGQALKKMWYYRCTEMPVIDHRDGQYMGTVTEDELHWAIEDGYGRSLWEAEGGLVADIRHMLRKYNHGPVEVDTHIEELEDMVIERNFVPVIDDAKCFIGFVTKEDVLRYMAEKSAEEEAMTG
ncbi:MAG: CBS domain-containing protein [Lachnospiraceae bacterium]|nr:CBS domain-containing protein [Lachnospiraceae bacterium]